MGSWTLTKQPGGFDPNTWELLPNLLRDNYYGASSTLFSMSVSADDKKSTENIICVSLIIHLLQFYYVVGHSWEKIDNAKKYCWPEHE